MNIPTLVILLLLTGIVALAVRKIVRDKKAGKCCGSCGGSCSSCGCTPAKETAGHER